MYGSVQFESLVKSGGSRGEDRLAYFFQVLDQLKDVRGMGEETGGEDESERNESGEGEEEVESERIESGGESEGEDEGLDGFEKGER